MRVGLLGREPGSLLLASQVSNWVEVCCAVCETPSFETGPIKSCIEAVRQGRRLHAGKPNGLPATSFGLGKRWWSTDSDGWQVNERSLLKPPGLLMEGERGVSFHSMAPSLSYSLASSSSSHVPSASLTDANRSWLRIDGT